METSNVKATHNQSIDGRELGIDASKLLDELICMEESKSDIQDNEITVQDYVTKTGLSKSGALYRLGKLVNSGVLVVRKARCKGQNINAYKRANNATDNT